MCTLNKMLYIGGWGQIEQIYGHGGGGNKEKTDFVLLHFKDVNV